VPRVVDAVRGAGLRVGAVDVVPLGLVRSLADAGLGEEAGAEAIVSVGGGTTVIVVHEDGLPRFVRVLGVGGRVLTEAIARELDLPLETAESVKRQGDLAPEDLGARARVAMERPLSGLLDEVRGSIDYYRTQPGAAPLRRVLVTGGTSRLAGLNERLGRLLGVPTEDAHPRDRIAVADIGFPAEEQPTLDPYLPVPVGLGLGGIGTTRRVDLTTLERRVVADRRVIAGIAAAAVVLLAVLTLLTTSKASSVAKARDQAAAVGQANDRLQAQASSLGTVRADQAQVDMIKGQVNQVLQGDVSWGRLLQGISRTIPNDVWLSSLQASASKVSAPAPSAAAQTAAGLSGSTASNGAAAASPAATAPASAGGPSGTINFNLTGLDYTSVAAWLQRLGGVPFLGNVWVASASRPPQAPGGPPAFVTFTSTATFNASVRSDRIKQLERDAAG
jgi:type IV pilus assembly protein PilM